MILLSGENTLLGSSLVPALRGSYSVCSFGPDKGDIGDPAFLEKIILQIAPKVLINTEIFSDPQEAEIKREEAYRINSYAPGIIAELCKKYNIFFIHISSAMVYPPLAKTHHSEDEKIDPCSVLADSLLYGESKITDSGCEYCILRPSPIYGKNDAYLMSYLSFMRERKKIQIIKDQKIMPLYIRDAVSAVVQIIEHRTGGIFNLAGSDECTAYELIFRFADLYQRERKIELSPVVEEIAYDEFESTAELPLYQLLNTERIHNAIQLRLHSLDNGLKELIDSISD